MYRTPAALIITLLTISRLSRRGLPTLNRCCQRSEDTTAVAVRNNLQDILAALSVFE
jgi:hypothetical protein